MVDLSSRTRRFVGKWIWAPPVTPRPKYFHSFERSEVNSFVLVRREFFLEDLVSLKAATLRVTADSRYVLFVNGTRVGKGPARCEPVAWNFDEWDVGGLLRSGKNVVAVHAVWFGVPFAYYAPPPHPKEKAEAAGKGGVIFDLELAFEHETRWVVSDASCRVKRDASRSPDSPFKNGCLGFVEEVDTRRLPAGWTRVEFEEGGPDDAGGPWAPAVELDYPLKTLVRSDVPPLHEEFVAPSEVVLAAEVADFVPDPEDLEEGERVDHCVQALLETPEPLRAEARNLASLAGGAEGPCRISSPGSGRSVTLVLKFPKEVSGHPVFDLEAEPGVVVDLITWEKVRDDGRLDGDWLSNKRGSRVVLRGGRQSFEQWLLEGFLYLQVTFRNVTSEVVIHRLGAKFAHFPYRERGWFECSDPLLNELWRTCAHTLKCCAADSYVDCPWREQRAYVGDAYVEALVAEACFGDGALTRKLLYDVALGQRADGVTFSFHPGDAPAEGHVIPDYSLYWIQLAEAYYRYHGDARVLRDLLPHFLLTIQWFLKYVDPETGLLVDVPHWVFVDWSEVDKRGAVAVLNAQFVDCLEIYCRFSEIVGAGEDFWKTKFGRLAASMKRRIHETFWDDREGCYRDCWAGGELSPQVSQHANAYLALKGVTPPELVPRLVERVFDRPGPENDAKQLGAYKRQVGSGYDPRTDVLVAQPFFMHHVNQFFAQVGRLDLAFKYFREGWGNMLRAGATTIWETWSPAGSLCHAWSATPAFDLSTHVLGVAPLEPGFSAVLVAPHFVDLEWARGVFPTCQGDVAVEWRVSSRDGALEAQVRVVTPPSIPRVAFRAPRLPARPLLEVRVDGTSLDPARDIHDLPGGDVAVTLLYGEVVPAKANATANEANEANEKEKVGKREG